MDETRISEAALPSGTRLSSPQNTYIIDKAIGAGGFGITYRASATVMVQNIEIDTFFAIKEHFINSLCDRQDTRVVYSRPVSKQVEGSLKDFISEARRLQKVGVSHPNIVRVNEVFEANNTAYYIMEYLEGESLQRFVRANGGPLSEEQTRRIMLPIIEAVGALHKAHLTHLDIKPVNIMITRRKDGSLRPVLIDFGLAKHYDVDGAPTSTINTLGCSAGYSPVEQYVGITSFSPTADIYSLGATMLFCLSGTTPVVANRITRADIEEAIPANVSEGMRQAILGAMAKNDADRTQSISEMLHQLGGELPPADGGDGGSDEPPQKVDSFVEATDVIADECTQTNAKGMKMSVALGIALLVAIVTFFCLRSCRGGEDKQDIQGIVDTLYTEKLIHYDFESLSSLEHLSLACVLNGKYYYFSQANWSKIPSNIKSKFEKKGVVIANKGEQFILDLEDSGKAMTWNEAMKRYGNRLPTKSQAEAMAADRVAVNAAILAFGGNKEWWYWTSAEYDSSYAWLVGMDSGTIYSYNKATTYKVRAVSPIVGSSSEAETTLSQTGDKEKLQCDFTSLSRLENLALACVLDGKYYYFSQANWNKIPADVKNRFTKKGVVVIGNGERFILDLHDSGKEMTWDEAMSRYRYGNRLPTKSQAEVMSADCKAINAAITAFGGDKDPAWWYWTSAESESNPSLAYVVYMGSYSFSDPIKTGKYRVRAVARVPSSAI